MPAPDPPQTPKQPEPPQPKLIFNWRDWIPYLADEDATEAEKRAMIEAVWSIVMAFIDLRWEVSDLGTDEKSCGQVLDLKAALEAAVLASTETASTPRTDRATPQPCGKDEAA